MSGVPHDNLRDKNDPSEMGAKKLHVTLSD